MKKGVTNLVIDFWQHAAIFSLILVVLAGVLWYRLPSLAYGFSEPEIAARAAANSGEKILNNPLFLPHKLGQYFMLKTGHEGVLAMRLVSTLAALVIVVIFYRVIRTWYTTRVALLTTLLFLTSSWLLHHARLGTPEILYASSIALLWAGLRIRGNNSRNRTLLLASVTATIMLYLPGMVWFIAAGVVWQRKKLLQEVNHLSKPLLALLGVSFLIGVAPLGYSFFNDPNLILTWLGLPDTFAWKHIVKDVVSVPLWLMFRGPADPVRWLGTLPFLDIFSLVMSALGLFVLSRKLALDRIRSIIFTILLGVVLASLGGPVNLILIMPIIYVVISTGIALLLQQWFTVFPRNPIARGVGTCLVIAMVLLTSFYHLSHYFIAWPKNTDTKQVYQQAL